MDKRRTVVHLRETNFVGGPEKQIIGHLRRLDRTRFRGLAASFLEGGRRNEFLETAAAQGLEQRGIPAAGAFNPGMILGVRRLLRSENVSLLCTHGYKSTVVGRLGALGTGIPTVAFSRGFTAEDGRIALYERLERFMLRVVDGIVCVSEGQRQRIGSYGIRHEHTWVVRNASPLADQSRRMTGTEREVLLQSFGIPPAARLIVSAGRLSPEKGHRFLVEAIPAVVERIPDAVFLFCGDGRCRGELEELAARLGVARCCRFPGFRRDLGEIFRAMDLMALPSLTEGLPNVVLEAFAEARPVVATAVGGVPEIVEDGRSGLLVPPGDARALAEAVIRVLSSPETALAMGRAGRERVQRDFTFERQNALLEGIYDAFLGRSGS